jgi:hypothetical protein
MIEEVKIKFGDVILLQRLDFDLGKSSTSFDDQTSNHDDHSEPESEPNLYLNLEG